MKKITTLLLTSFLVISGSAQQIGDGLAAPYLLDFSGLLKSGVYGGYAQTLGKVPDVSADWNHLFVVRHANPDNNFQLQIASSFAENDRLFFRKIAGDLTPKNPNWVELATRGINTFTGDQSVFGNLIIENTSARSGFEVVEVTDSKPQGEMVPTKSVLKLSRYGTANYSYNENAEFRIGHGGSGVYGSKLDLYINGSTNKNSIPDQHAMTWNYDGNVGIGTITPNNKLDVNGTIHSKEVKVDLLGWSDFVFKKDYKLPTLEDVEKHIKEKGHLENIPSEEEALKNGINLGEMNAKLLQKIEELTLYMIEMKSKQSELENTIKELTNKIK
ncbi:hypothetical protein [Flavobacterium hydatis]|uniref:Cell wall anchor protein n=1 Tax=Flavobacterium hydatis TaxID=991 RepID=A0ABX4CBG5_FLAHY|nr:hypothetical protein [Flavobacterium hydatis]OXA90296.1 hypothetical protein B0A62_19690 [Flavobacterium hydatis]